MMMGWDWQPKGVVDTRLVEPTDAMSRQTMCGWT
jgi:hypothetical protein